MNDDASDPMATDSTREYRTSARSLGEATRLEGRTDRDS